MLVYRGGGLGRFHCSNTAEPLIVDSPKQGHSVITLSTKDKAGGSKTHNFSPLIQYNFEPPKEDNFLTTNKQSCPEVSFVWRFHCTMLTAYNNVCVYVY